MKQMDNSYLVFFKEYITFLFTVSVSRDEEILRLRSR